MSSALAMIVTAAMVVPGDMPEKVSGEMEERLDLRGEWEGRWWPNKDASLEVTLRDGSIQLSDKSRPSLPVVFKIIDEAEGVLHVQYDASRHHGIYKWDNDRLVLCLREANKGRPTSFQARDGQQLFILHRVKPRK
jgi:uncharacterized protein (TIGR03067 family)